MLPTPKEFHWIIRASVFDHSEGATITVFQDPRRIAITVVLPLEKIAKIIMFDLQNSPSTRLHVFSLSGIPCST
jgi:hypothetical protein